jgi:hypothetical protein
MIYLSTLAALKIALGIQDPVDDTNLTRLIESVQGRFEAHLRRRLARGARVEYFDGGVSCLELEQWPIEAMTSVHVSSDQDWGADNLVAATDYRRNDLRGLVWYGTAGTSAWPEGIQNIRVAYDGGYVSAGSVAAAGQYAVPEEIRAAFEMQTQYEWRNRENLGRQSVNAAGASIALAPAELLPAVIQALAPHRRL